MESTRKYRATERTCCTCEFWTGTRKIDISSQKFVTASPRDSAICLGIHRPQSKLAQDKMQCWTRWLLLNENNKSEVLRQLQEIIEILKA